MTRFYVADRAHCRVITDLGHCGIGGCRKSPLPVDMGNDWKSRKRSSRRKKQQPEEIDGADAVVAGGTTERGRPTENRDLLLRQRKQKVLCFCRTTEEGKKGTKAEEQPTVRRNEEKSDGVTDLDDRLWLRLGEETLVAGRRNKTLVEPFQLDRGSGLPVLVGWASSTANTYHRVPRRGAIAIIGSIEGVTTGRQRRRGFADKRSDKFYKKRDASSLKDE
ncbi:hypothetical protein BHM03_00056620 [Ensete ventricosum]|nr:hypothetical protein BHM03_00056620 [Ensete ventricosum]